MQQKVHQHKLQHHQVSKGEDDCDHDDNGEKDDDISDDDDDEEDWDNYGDCKNGYSILMYLMIYKNYKV